MIEGQEDLALAGAVANAEDALKGIANLVPDVAIIDVALPGMSGTTLIERLTELHPRVKYIALTAHEDPSSLRQALAAGAQGFVVKRSTATDLLHAIRCVLAGGSYVDPALAARLVKPSHAGSSADANSLSDRERSVIRLVALGYSNKEISAHLNLSVKTVETYRTRASEKLNLRSRAAIVRFAQSNGWLAATPR